MQTFLIMSKPADTIHSVKGVRDLLPEECALWQRLEAEARGVFGAYCFQEIRTPVIEPMALFVRTVGGETDIVSKEMYTFLDRDDEQIALRPEATAGVVRAYIEHSLYNQGGTQKLFYMGPMFRRERPQKGRYRQFHQIGAEVIGSDHPLVDVEALEMLVLLLERTGIQQYSLLINSVGCPRCRPEYLRVLRQALESVKAGMCNDCQRRTETNPLRVLDCKVEADQSTIEKLPRIVDYLCAECQQHFEAVKSGLQQRKIAFSLAPRLVRGLDYYMRTTFEVTTGGLGAQNALLGGGRYDRLAEMLGGPPAPGFGFAIGEERLVMAAAEAGFLKPASGLDVYVAWMGEAAAQPAMELTRALRQAGLGAEAPLEPLKLKKMLGVASKSGARFSVIIGEGELASGKYQVKDMSAGSQEEVEAGRVAEYLYPRLGR